MLLQLRRGRWLHLAPLIEGNGLADVVRATHLHEALHRHGDWGFQTEVHALLGSCEVKLGHDRRLFVAERQDLITKIAVYLSLGPKEPQNRQADRC